MKSNKKKTQPVQPAPKDLTPLLKLQQQFGQVGVETPFGSQTYRTNPDGSRTLVTGLSPQGQGLVDRSMQLGMMDSEQVGVPGQVNDIAQQLANRVGGRFGLQPGQNMRLGGQAPKPNNSQLLPPAQGVQQQLPPISTGTPPPQQIGY